jgi:hypothetical protein
MTSWWSGKRHISSEFRECIFLVCKRPHEEGENKKGMLRKKRLGCWGLNPVTSIMPLRFAPHPTKGCPTLGFLHIYIVSKVYCTLAREYAK